MTLVGSFASLSRVWRISRLLSFVALLALSDEALGEYLGYARVLWSFEWKALPR